MSDELWYVRDRNRVTGPFNHGQLVGLRHRGQLARFHQVSRDRQTWVDASTLTDVFVNPSTANSIELAPALDSTSPPSHASWYHHNGQAAVGPVSEQELLEMARRGAVHSDTKVWKEGMASWTPFGQISSFGLNHPIPINIVNQGDRESRATDNLSARTSGLAVASLVLGILWLCGIGSLLATIFGAVAINQITHSNGKLTGKGMAIAGLVLGIVGLASGLLPFLVPGILATW